MREGVREWQNTVSHLVEGESYALRSGDYKELENRKKKKAVRGDPINRVREPRLYFDGKEEARLG